MVVLIILLSAPAAFGQLEEIVSPNDTIGFGYKTIDTIRALPGDTISLPVFLSTDSMVTAVSMLFEFDPSIFQPQIAFDKGYQDLLDSHEVNPAVFVPDSADYSPVPGIWDDGLWNVQMFLDDQIRQSWNFESGTQQVLYNLNNRGHARLLMMPELPFDTAGYNMPFIQGELGDDGLNEPDDDGGGVIAYIRFKIDSNVIEGSTSVLWIEDENEDDQSTELAQHQDTLGVGLFSTIRVLPTRRATLFIAEADSCVGDTCDDDTIPTGQNHLPNINISPPQSVYEINPGQQVSFTVTATDVEAGQLELLANNGNLPPNASFGTGGQVIGGGGFASGSFSFVPDVSQQGNFLFTFKATDDSSASVTSSVSVTVAKPDVDVLFTTSADGLSPSGGVPGLTGVMVPINVVTNNVVYGVQFDMDYDANQFDLDSVVTSDRVSDWVIYENIGIDPGYLRVVAFGLASDSMVSGSTSAALYLAFTVDEFAVIGGYPLNIYNAWESINPDPGVPSIELETDSGVIYVDQWGDVNLDLRIDVADLVNAVAYIIGTYNLSNRQFATADIIIDSLVNVVDLVGIINTIFGFPASSPAPELNGDEFALLTIAHEGVPEAGIESEMKVLADMPTEVAGVELEIQYNPSVVEMLAPRLAGGSDGFRISSNDNGAGHMKVLIYSDHPWNDYESIQKGLSDIVKLPFISRGRINAGDNRHVRITQAYMSTGSAKSLDVQGVDPVAIPGSFELYQNHPNPFNPLTTIDFYIGDSGPSGDDVVHLEVFNILGQRIRTLLDEVLPPGQHSVIWDGKDDHGVPSASGIYLYRLRVGEDSQTKKMMLLK
jgi:hypothetical protein